VVGVQIGLGLAFAPPISKQGETDGKRYYATPTPKGWTEPSSSYLRLNNWDSLHYFEIAERGYHLPEGSQTFTNADVNAFRATGAFFPGYPVAVSLVRDIFGISTELSLLWVAQIAAVLFWVYFF
jgi:hypothetical protein